jgi:hypothetical protein
MDVNGSPGIHFAVDARDDPVASVLIDDTHVGNRMREVVERRAASVATFNASWYESRRSSGVVRSTPASTPASTRRRIFSAAAQGLSE